ncbi:ArsR/SmtB family transcription factor [Halobellus rufus]|uniref:ArsR/SmtB family transcription factor n=1 Tax=Halobellus rufus TaxID=1448860 RepID=UPI000678C55B|nr:hypothetical protein [Halobellus rufus]
MSKEVTSVSFDSHLDALGHIDRRRILLALLHADTEGDLPVGIDQLVEGTDRSSARVSIHHVHLPKLDEYGFVNVTRDNHAVTPGPRFDEISPLLELLDQNTDQLPDDWS